MAVVCNKVKEGKKLQAAAKKKEYSRCDIIELVEKAIGGSFLAFGELYSIYLDRIYRYVYYQINDRMAAEDITEDVFVKAWKAIKSCKGKEATFSSWLYRIAHNHLVNTLRRENKLTSIENIEVTGINKPEVIAEANAEYQELMRNITCLPENQKQVIIFKFIEGMDNREIGKITGKSEGAIRISQMRALASLREKLG